MVNKKKKNRQPGPDEQNASDSTESCEESQAGAAGAKCPHVQRSVDLNRVKKALKTGILRKCGECEKAPLPEVESEEVKSDEAEAPKESGGLWLCLRCGHQACGRDVRAHAKGHFSVPHSDCHALALGAELRRVWCYSCDAEVPVTAKKKLQECVEFVARQEDAPPAAPLLAAMRSPAHDSPREGKEEGSRSASNAIVTGISNGPDSPLKELPRLRGLRNNGNTCFFNAVLQCLAHTPFLLEVLTETRESGETFSLPGRPEDPDDPLPAISGTLPGWGALTETLASTLAGLRTGAADALNPAPLMDKLSARCPLFEGGDQHDAQELLRHLLEGVRAEDLKRYQSGILGQLGLSGRSDPDAVPEETRARVKLYGRQAAELRLRPDHVFRGTLVSTLECQDCMHASQRPETFLDLSLPITADKPQPPVVTRRKSEEQVAVASASKHQLKREKKAARKGAKAGRGHTARHGPAAADGSDTILEEKPSSQSAESEPSDADVEDNLDGDAVPAESGYSSAKAGDSPPLPASPPLAGDSALASPANAMPSADADANANVFPHSAVRAGGDNRRSLEVSGSDEVLFESATSPGTGGPQELATALGFQLATLIDQAQSDGRVSPASSEAELGPADRQLDDADLAQEEDHQERPVSRFAFVPEGSHAVRRLDLSPDGLGDGSPLPGGGVSEEEVNHLIKELSKQTLDISGDLPPLEEIDGLFDLMNQPQDSPPIRLTDLDSTGQDSAGEWSSLLTEVRMTFGQEGSTFEQEIDEVFVAMARPLDLPARPTPCFDSPARPLTDLDSTLEPILVQDSSSLESPDQQTIEVQTIESEGGKEPVIEETEPMLFGPLEAGAGPIALGWTEPPPPPAMPSPAQQAVRLPTSLELKRPSSPDSSGQGSLGRWGSTLAAKLTTRDGECSVMSCLNQFTAVELMTGNNRVGCEACTKRQNHGAEGKLVTTNSTKQFLVAAPPPVLILHLKRFQLQRSMLRKMALHVAFPPLLDLASLISSQDSVGTEGAGSTGVGGRRVLYALYGVVEHSGAMQYGHYVAYVKVRAAVPAAHPRWAFLADGGPASRVDPAAARPPPGKWFYVSDSRVNEVNEERVLRAEAYLLFYERIC